MKYFRTKRLDKFFGALLDVLVSNEYLEEIAPVENATKKKRNLSDADFVAELKENPLYKNINLDIEFAKMKAWLMTRPGRLLTRKFAINWLNSAVSSVVSVPEATSKWVEKC